MVLCVGGFDSGSGSGGPGRRGVRLCARRFSEPSPVLRRTLRTPRPLRPRRLPARACAPRTNETSRRLDRESARCAGETFTPPRLPFPFSRHRPLLLDSTNSRVLKIEAVHFSQPAFDNGEVLSNAWPPPRRSAFSRQRGARRSGDGPQSVSGPSPGPDAGGSLSILDVISFDVVQRDRCVLRFSRGCRFSKVCFVSVRLLGFYRIFIFVQSLRVVNVIIRRSSGVFAFLDCMKLISFFFISAIFCFGVVLVLLYKLLYDLVLWYVLYVKCVYDLFAININNIFFYCCLL